MSVVVVLDRIENVASLWESVALPWVLADKDSAIGVMKVRSSSDVLATEELPLHPVHPSLLLG